MRAGVLVGKLLPTGMVEGRLVGREDKLVVFLSGFRFVLGAKSESKISIGIRQLRGRSSGTARARKLWQLAENEQRGPEKPSVTLLCHRSGGKMLMDFEGSCS